MKRTSLLLITILITGLSYGQRLSVTTYVEKTSVSPKSGIMVGAESEYGIEYGGFYQESSILESVLMSSEAVAQLPRRYEKVFWGAYFAYPIVFNRTVNIKLNIRTGIVNGESFTITPSVLGKYRLNKKVSIGGGIGVRAFRPTLQTQIAFRL